MEISILGHSIKYTKKSQDDIDLYNNNQKLTYKSFRKHHSQDANTFMISIPKPQLQRTTNKRNLVIKK
jgi:hypothetical protein